MSGICPSFLGLGCQEGATLVPEWLSFITGLICLSESSPNYARSCGWESGEKWEENTNDERTTRNSQEYLRCS